MNTADILIKYASQYPVLHKSEELELVRDWKTNNTKKSFDTIINSNIRFVTLIAMKYKSKLPLEDLVQEGIIGMIKSLEKFDPDMGFRVVTFAKMQIKNEIYKYIIRNKIDFISFDEYDAIEKAEIDQKNVCEEIIRENAISTKMKDIYKIIDELTEIEKRIIINYIMYEKESFDNIAKIYDIKKPKVNKIYKLAIRKLKMKMSNILREE